MTSEPVAVVDDLHAWFGADEVVSGVGFRLDAGACVALVGQSGSGKSVTARSLVGLAGPGARVSAGELRVCGQDLRHATPRQWRRVRGAQVGLVLQDALVSLDPLRPVGREIDDALRLHTRMGIAARRRRVLEALRDAGIPDPERRAGQRAGELSGGLRQRALIAAAIALRPPLIIADEPTTALDATVQRHVLETLGRLRDDGTAVLMISHDLAVVSALADRIVVMHDGAAVEAGNTRDVLAAPAHAYTRRLLAAIPGGRARGAPLAVPSASPAPLPRVHNRGDLGVHNRGDLGRHAGAGTDSPAWRAGDPPSGTRRDGGQSEQPLLDVRHVSRTFGSGRDARTAVDDVSLQVFPGRTLGLVGDSGSGKTTTARIALGLTVPDRGTVELCGRRWAPAPERDRRHRRHLVGAVYQDPFSSFDPRWSVGGILTDALTGGASRSARRHAEAVSELLDAVGLSADTAGRNPRSLSGGQRQRVAIARALAPRPAVLICDEPVSSLDVLVQAQILDLLDRLQRRFDIGYLFISHDLDVVRHMSDTVAVMRDGRIVDAGDADDVLTPARHPMLSLTATTERIPDA